jgi:putative membrane protein
MPLILHWIIATAAVLIAAYLLPGVAVSGVFTALVVAVVLGLANALIRPLLLLLTLPITILTLGLFTFVINALMILLVASIVPGFHVDGFWWALLFSIILTLVSGLLRSVV